LLRVERLDIVGGFAHADELHRQGEFFADGDDDPAACRAVEFGQEDAGDFGGGGEHLGLVDAVLPCGGVEHQNHFVRRVGNLFRDDVSDLGQLSHQVVLRVQSAGGVDDEYVH